MKNTIPSPHPAQICGSGGPEPWGQQLVQDMAIVYETHTHTHTLLSQTHQKKHTLGLKDRGGERKRKKKEEKKKKKPYVPEQPTAGKGWE